MSRKIVALAALALAGFHPEFAGGKSYPTLRSRLAAFGAAPDPVIPILTNTLRDPGLGATSMVALQQLGPAGKEEPVFGEVFQ